MSATSNLTAGLIFLLVISGVLFLVYVGVSEDSEGSTFGGTGLLDKFGNSSTGTINEFESGALPESEQSVSPETGTSFTDLFRTAKNWILDTTGARYVIDFVGAPIVLLRSMGINSTVVFVIGAMWYGFFVFLIVSWLFNR